MELITMPYSWFLHFREAAPDAFMRGAVAHDVYKDERITFLIRWTGSKPHITQVLEELWP